MPGVKPRDAIIVCIVVIALVGAGTFVLSTVTSSSASSSSCNPRAATPKLWNFISSGGTHGNFDMGFGTRYAALVNFTTPSTTTFFCIIGNFSASYATGGFTNASGNQTVTCGSSTPQCDVLVGLWTPTAWASYSAGASAQPIWCYGAHNGACGAQSSGSYSTGDLGVRGPADLVYAMWTETDWNPWGPAAFSAYVNAP
jgi:hypothetical protein